MESLVLFLEGKDGTQKMLGTFSSKVAIEFGKEIIEGEKGVLIIPLDGTQKYRDILKNRISALIEEVHQSEALGDEDIRSLECLTSLYTGLGKAKPGNRMFNHYHFNLI